MAESRMNTFHENEPGIEAPNAIEVTQQGKAEMKTAMMEGLRYFHDMFSDDTEAYGEPSMINIQQQTCMRNSDAHIGKHATAGWPRELGFGALQVLYGERRMVSTITGSSIPMPGSLTSTGDDPCWWDAKYNDELSLCTWRDMLDCLAAVLGKPGDATAIIDIGMLDTQVDDCIRAWCSGIRAEYLTMAAASAGSRERRGHRLVKVKTKKKNPKEEVASKKMAAEGSLPIVLPRRPPPPPPIRLSPPPSGPSDVGSVSDLDTSSGSEGVNYPGGEGDIVSSSGESAVGGESDHGDGYSSGSGSDFSGGSDSASSNGMGPRTSRLSDRYRSIRPSMHTLDVGMPEGDGRGHNSSHRRVSTRRF